LLGIGEQRDGKRILADAEDANLQNRINLETRQTAADVLGLASLSIR
jgi:hypothetical protein